MARSAKKTSATHARPGAKQRSHAKSEAASGQHAANAAFNRAAGTRESADSFVRLGTDTMKEFFSTGTDEAQKAHEKVFAIGRESADNLSRAVDAFTRTVGDLVTLGRENADAAVEVSHIAADIAKSINAELVSSANSNFSDNVELCKEAFACRTINDAYDLQSKWLSNTLDNFFSQSSRLAEMYYQLATEAAEPINERVAEATERFSRSLAA